MPIASGTRIGPYLVLSAIGAGGMGEVYRARDIKLGREVAIKVLPELFADDPDRIARFQREAQLLAALNHPHIAAIYGLEDAGGITALAMELVEGDDLAKRLAVGAMPLDETLAIATQLAQALDAAHEQGIVHRDLKPANIKIRADGTAKVLDFGLAKLTENPGTPLRSDLASLSPTLTSPVGMTAVGMILGTAAYMSPEQARGRAADKRCDVWAFGCVLYEMLTGRRPFAGDDVSEVLAFVITREPDWEALPAATPGPLRKLLRRCLEKDPRRRLRDIGDALAELDAAKSPEAGVQAPAPGPGRRPGRRWLERAGAAASLVAACTATGVFVWRAKPSPAAAITRFTLALPADQQITGTLGRTVGLSPDGTRVIYVANNRLYVRAMSENEARPIAGTDTNSPRGGLMFAWSPDSRSIAYVGDDTIKRISLDGGGAATICSFERSGAAEDGVVNTTYPSWGPAGIVFVGRNGIMRVSPDGGTPERIAVVDDSAERVQDPQLLPDGRTLLFGVARTADALMDRWDTAEIVVQSTPAGQRRTVIRGTSPRYVRTGHLLYSSGSALLAVPFDAVRQQVTGTAVTVVEGVRRSLSTSISQYSVADNGSLIYIPGPTGASVRRTDLVTVSPSGEVARLPLPEASSYEFPRYSPDGSELTFDADTGPDRDVWIYRLAGDSAVRRLTFVGHNRHPIWSRDGQWITFQSDREGDFGLFRQRADGTGAAERLTKAAAGTAHVPQSWSPHDEFLLYSSNSGGVLNARTGANNRGSTSELLMWSAKDRRTAPFAGVRSHGRAANAEFSPDGQWVAYSAGVNPSVVYVRPFPASSVVYQLSKSDDGHHPWWSRDGRELFYVPGPDSLSKVSVTTRPAFSFSNPVPVPRGGVFESPVSSRSIDTSPDGTRLVGVAPDGAGASQTRIQIVLNWFEDLKRLAPRTR